MKNKIHFTLFKICLCLVGCVFADEFNVASNKTVTASSGASNLLNLIDLYQDTYALVDYIPNVETWIQIYLNGGIYPIHRMFIWPTDDIDFEQARVTTFVRLTNDISNNPQDIFCVYNNPIIGTLFYCELKIGHSRYGKYVLLKKDIGYNEKIIIAEIAIITTTDAFVPSIDGLVEQSYEKPGFESKYAIDNNDRTCISTTQDDVTMTHVRGWWRADLGISFDISVIVLSDVWRDKESPDGNYVVYIDNDGFTRKNPCIYTDQSIFGNPTYSFYCRYKLYGRYLTIEKNITNIYRQDSISFCDIFLISYEKDASFKWPKNKNPITARPPVTFPTKYTGQLPPALNIPMKFFGSNLNLKLNINPDLPENLPITVSSDTGTFEKPNILPVGAYNDDLNKASLIVKFFRDGNTEFSPKVVMGSIIRDNFFYTLIRTNANNADVEINNSKFRILKEDLNNLTNNCFLTDINKKTAELYNTQKRKRRQATQNKKIYTIELMIIVDNSMEQKFEKWCEDRSTCIPSNCSAALCKLQTQLNLQSYVFLLINLASNRFYSIEKTSFAIKLQLNNITIIEPKQLIAANRTAEGYINGNEALETFGKYFTSIYRRTPYYDHAVLLFDYSIYFSTPAEHEYTGHSYLGGMCQLNQTDSRLNQSISLVKERGLFATVASIAHEIAHNMLARHDGDSNNCPESDQYIMASAVSGLNPTNAGNIYYFSWCTIVAINSFLGNLDRQNERNCLLVANGNMEHLKFKTYSLDEQCTFIYGDGSKHCKGDHLDICYRLECINPSTNACFISDEARAIDNTTCGQQGDVCKLGACYYTSGNGPESNLCRYGDYIGSFFVDGNTNFTCSMLNARASMTEAEKLINPQRFRCYNTEVNRRCCQSCKYLTSSSLNVACKYGNRDAGYCGSSSGVSEQVANAKCYNSYYEENCCAFCQVSFPTVNCKYGDRESWCETSVNNDQCLNNNTRTNCCKSCSATRKPSQATPSTTTKSLCIDIWGTYCQTSLKQSDCTGEIKDIYCCITCNSFTYSPTIITITSTSSKPTPVSTSKSSTPTPTTLSTREATFKPTSPPITVSPTCNGDLWESWCWTSLNISRCNEEAILINCCFTCRVTTRTFTAPKTDSITITRSKICLSGNIWGDWCTSNANSANCQDTTIYKYCCQSCLKILVQ